MTIFRGSSVTCIDAWNALLRAGFRVVGITTDRCHASLRIDGFWPEAEPIVSRFGWCCTAS